MKKRIMLILVVGISFTPAVFAAEENFNDVTPQAIACNRSEDKKIQDTKPVNQDEQTVRAGVAQ